MKPLFTSLSIGLLLVFCSCANQAVPTERILTPEERAALQRIEKSTFLEAKRGRSKEILAHNNLLWIELYEASRQTNRTFGVKRTETTDEGDPITTYFLATNGTVEIITDYRLDRFSGGGVKVDKPVPFLMGYDGIDLPCPCGRGKTWLECAPGRCRAPTFVIMRTNFPMDKELRWIPPPTPREIGWTWKEGP